MEDGGRGLRFQFSRPYPDLRGGERGSSRKGKQRAWGRNPPEDGKCECVWVWWRWGWTECGYLLGVGGSFGKVRKGSQDEGP